MANFIKHPAKDDWRVNLNSVDLYMGAGDTRSDDPTIRFIIGKDSISWVFDTIEERDEALEKIDRDLLRKEEGKATELNLEIKNLTEKLELVVQSLRFIKGNYLHLQGAKSLIEIVDNALIQLKAGDKK